LDYHLKYADRSALARLLQRRDDCDEILIVRDGAITDTSYSNVAFFDGRKYVTPDTFLLNGTRRQYLLGTGVLTECRITPSDLGGFERVVLINAMLGIEDDLAVPIERIRGL
jgi:4-amino-4-deoxychorismate lyase